MEFDERLKLYLDGGMIDEKDVLDINKIINLFKDKYNIVLTEDNASFFISHLCSAYSRSKTQEKIDPVDNDILAQIKRSKTYSMSLNILKDIFDITNNPFNEIERDYMLLHINNLLTVINGL